MCLTCKIATFPGHRVHYYCNGHQRARDATVALAGDVNENESDALLEQPANLEEGAP
jgi:hypothetical protein